MPPPISAFIVVKPHDKVSTKINLADNYTFDGNRYKVKYIGGGVSGLQTRKTVTFSIDK